MVNTQTVNIEISKPDEILNLRFISDGHIGDKNFREDLYSKEIKKAVDNPYDFLMYLGDNIDCIFGEGTDPRYKAGHCAPGLDTLAAQQEEFERLNAEVFEEHIRFMTKFGFPKILGAHWGNHEFNSRLITYADQKKYFRRFMIKFLGARCMTRLNIFYKGKNVMKKDIFSAHGAGGGMDPMKPLNDMADSVYADLFVMGHLHQQAGRRHLIQYYDNASQGWKTRRVLKVNAGCFVDGIQLGEDSWLEQKKNKLVLSESGNVTVSFDPYKQKMRFHM